MRIGRDAGLAGRLSLCTGKTQGHGRIVCQPLWLDIVTTRRTISEVSRLDPQERRPDPLHFNGPAPFLLKGHLLNLEGVHT